MLQTKQARIADATFPVLALTGTDQLNHGIQLQVIIESSIVPQEARDNWLGQNITAQITEPEQMPVVVAGMVSRIQLVKSHEAHFHYQVSLTSRLLTANHKKATQVFVGVPAVEILRTLAMDAGYLADQIVVDVDNAQQLSHQPFVLPQGTIAQQFKQLAALHGFMFWSSVSADGGSDGIEGEEQLIIANSPQHYRRSGRSFVEKAGAGQGGDGRGFDASEMIRELAVEQHWRPHTNSEMVLEHPSTLYALDEQAAVQGANAPLDYGDAVTRAKLNNDALTHDANRYVAFTRAPIARAGQVIGVQPITETLLSGWDVASQMVAKTVKHHLPIGERYSGEVELVPDHQAVRLPVKTELTLPPVFVAKVISPNPTPKLDGLGEYQIRAMHDGQTEGDEAYSPQVPSLKPYASPDPEKAVGWHMPLHDGTDVLLTCLNQDLMKPLMLGVACKDTDEQMVTAENYSEYRIKTRASNELWFEDNDQQIELKTWEGQIILRFEASANQVMTQLITQFGSQYWQANKTFALTVGSEEDADLTQFVGDNFSLASKADNTTTVTGNAHWQSAADLSLRSQANMTFATEGDWQQQISQGTYTQQVQADHSTTLTGGDHTRKIVNGAIVTQSGGDITIEGTGSGKLMLVNGDGGILIKSNGDVKIFGPMVALNPNSKVTLTGEVEYEVGPSNAPESGKEPKVSAFCEQSLLEARNQPLQYDPLARGRDTVAEDPAGKEMASVLIKDEQGNPQIGVRLLITLPDGNEMLVKTDEAGRVNLKKDNLSGASVRVLGKTVAPASGGE
ncbi:contractile injection system protein, VgrG/Pvc8 family [Salinibius halmophilus]|uniref:contractile injection system protein, VgrG/Pvc8 family n=1 Tax=Salinibius halmophilus TaxID=1853216 RepID=UPI000E6761D5|nr:contractile injection system protein, VgrG/Pvc8 family [Salinibius halmophilus]